MTQAPDPSAVQAILLDIEGTTTPIAFVSEVLFPYARRHLQRHLDEHATEDEYQRLFDRLRNEHVVDRAAGEAVPSWPDRPSAERVRSVVAYLEWQMDRDRKTTNLKTLQGKIWEEGYRRGELVGEVFPDVPPALKRWNTRGLRIAIFSSGSTLAQQLLFRHSSAGDLTASLHDFFDTTTGAKGDSDSYRRIADRLAVTPEATVFVSDVTRELEAAREAGMQTRLSIRPGNALPPAQHDFTEIRTFDELN